VTDTHTGITITFESSHHILTFIVVEKQQIHTQAQLQHYFFRHGLIQKSQKEKHESRSKLSERAR